MRGVSPTTGAVMSGKHPPIKYTGGNFARGARQNCGKNRDNPNKLITANKARQKQEIQNYLHFLPYIYEGEE